MANNNFSLSIRLGTRDDLPTLADIEISAARLYPPGKIPEPHDSLPYPVLCAAINNQLLLCAEVHTAKQKKIVVGFAACHVYKNFLHLDEISVLPKFGQQGIGSRLVQAVISVSQSKQCQGTTLTTFSDLAWNAPFYKKLGFSELAFSASPVEVQAMLNEEQALGLVNRIAMLRTN